jgi:hypothetical protein
MNSARPVETMDDVLMVLAAARRRWWVIKLLHVALFSLGFAAAVVTAIVLAASYTPFGPTDSVGLGGAAALTASLFAASMLVGTGVTARSAPSLLDMGHRADAFYGLSGRIATATEVRSCGNPPTLVAQALFEDACRRARRMVPRQFVPLGLPRWTLATPLLLSAFAATMVLADQLGAPVPLETRDHVMEADLDATMRSLHRVTELLQRDLDAQRDPYVRAVTEALHDLEQRYSAGAASAADLGSEVDRLLTQLSQALASHDSALGAAIDRLSEGAATSSASGAPMSGAATDATIGAGDPTNAEPEVMLTRGPGPSTLDRLVEELERREAAAATSNAQGSGSGQVDDAASEVFEIYDGMFGTPFQPTRETDIELEGAGVPIGVAEESTDRAGDAAGDGVQVADSGSPVGQTVEVFGDEFEVLALPDRSEDAGRRIELDVVPDAAAGVVYSASPPGTTARPMGAYGPSTHGTIGLAYREAIVDYFMWGTVGTPIK